MAIEWKDEQVNDHSSGITDLVTASDSSFQEACRNLAHNPKLQLLSSRDGYRRVITNTARQCSADIMQLFKLEDWILALCSDGQVYYRLESDTTSFWTQLETPKQRTSTLFRIYDSTGKGFTLRVTSPSAIYDQFVVKGQNLGSGVGTTPSVGITTTRTITLGINTFYVTAAKTFNSGTVLTYASLASLFAVSGWTFTRLTGTLATDPVVFNELFAIQESTTSLLGFYPANTRAEGDGTALGFAGEEGHLQASEWQSHLFLALEPYIKTFTANTSDPYGADPETFPPDNNRLPLRKILPAAPAGGGTTLRAVNAQLPKIYLGIETNQSTPNTYTNAIASYRYQVYTLKWNYMATAYGTDETASIEIWCERTWGQLGLSGTMTLKGYLRSEKIAGAKNPIDDSIPFSLCDQAISGAVPYTSVTAPTWGEMVLCFHENDASSQPIKSLSFTEVVEAIQAAFTEYQTRNVKVGATFYQAAYRNFGFYIKVNPKARMDAQVDVNSPLGVSYRYADNLPEDVAGNHTYGYAFFLRDSYQAMVEGSPRSFQMDGPAAFVSVRTLSPIGFELQRGYTNSGLTDEYTFTSGPWVFGGISASILRSTSLYFQAGMEGVFARTLDGGNVYYIDEASKFWFRTGETPTWVGGISVVPPSLTASTGDNWTTKTSYILVHQSQKTDDTLQYKEQAYFNGGILSYDSIPQGPYFFDVVNQTGYYANIVGNIQRLYQSPPGAPYASPATIFEDLDDAITGLSHFLDKPIVTTGTRILRVEGTKGADGAGRTFIRTVSDEFGCVSNQSIVGTNLGLFLWSNSGIIYTDGIKALRVSEHLITTYQGWLAKVRASDGEIGPRQLRGFYNALDRKVYWSLYDKDHKPFFVVLSLQKGIGATMPITIEDGIRFSSVDAVTGAVTTTDYFETHANLYSADTQKFYRGQKTYLMVRDSARSYDESHVTGLKHPIDGLYKSIAFAYGIPWARKQTSKISMNLRDLTGNGVSLTPLGWNDLSTSSHQMTNCLNYQHMAFAVNYSTASKLDLQQFFRHSDCRWKSDQIVTYERHFGRGSQRNCFKQVGFQSMKMKWAEINQDTADISDIQVIHKNGFPQRTAFIQIVSAVSSNAVLDSMDASGQFYVQFEPNQTPVAICDIVKASFTYTIRVIMDGVGITNGSDKTVSWSEISFYRLFTDQRIDLLGYNVTFRVIGDRSQGSLKSEDKGGVDA